MKPKTTHFPVLCMVALSMLLITGCTDLSNPPIQVTSVMIAGEAQPIMAGDTLQLSATVDPVDATNTQVSWASSNPKIASVDDTGLVTAISHGSTAISVTTEDQDKTDTVQISVYNGYVNITFTNTADSGDTYSFWLTSGPVEGTYAARDTRFTEFEVPSHTVRDMSSNGSRIIASNNPMDEMYGEFIPSDDTYPFESFEIFVPGAIDESCIDASMDVAWFLIRRMVDTRATDFEAAYSYLPSLPVQVIFTEFGADYVGGTLSGSISDFLSTNYAVSGDFRVLRAQYTPEY